MPSFQLPADFSFLFEGEYRYRAAYGGRGSAKSHSFGAALVIKARQRPLRILCCREIQDSIKHSVKRVLDDKIAACGFGDFFTSTLTDIVGKNGSHFGFAGLRSNPDAVKSMEGIDIAFVDEASRISSRSLELLIPTIRKPGSEIWFAWNPDSPKDPVDMMFRGETGPPPRTIVKGPLNFDSNPWFSDVMREEMEWAQRRDPAKYAHIWLGGYRRNSEAQVFHNWRVEPFETPQDVRRFYFGADFGFVDPTVMVRCWLKDRTLYVDYEVWQVRCDIDKTPALFAQIPGSTQWPSIADSADPQSISYLRQHGFPRMTAAIKGPNSINEGVEFLKSYDIVVHPRCTHVIDELTDYSYEVDEHTEEVLPKLADKKNHTIDSLRYATEPLRQTQSKRVYVDFMGR